MLKSLEIKNYAIIDHLTIAFDEKLNIITGETGAGKSILLGALGLTLGERADSKVLYNKDQKCFIEAIFQLKNQKLKLFFNANDLDFDKELHVRREISVSGKSRAFINDTPVNLNTLKTLTEQLVNLHSQQETGLLNQQGFQISVLDYTAKNTKILEEYQNELINLKTLRKELATIKESTSLLQQDLDFNLFQLKEINEANLEGEEIEKLESELSVLSHSEEIKSVLFEISSGISNEESSALNILNELSSKLSKIGKYSEELQKLSERLESSVLEIQDINNDAEVLAENTELDEERIHEVSEMVNVGNKLLQKHKLNTIEDLMLLKEDLESKTSSVADMTEKISALETKIEKQEKKLNLLCNQLSTARKKVIPEVEKKITSTLQKIGMPNANFEVKQELKENFDQFGKDEIQFLFSSNKGFEPQNLSKIASGGELSRVMLSIKYLLAENTELPTLIFDEIDTGISGEVASKVGDVFKDISKNLQLISITHLPQIAAKADKHFFIYKEDSSEKTNTKIATLSPEKHIRAIARMLSGDSITEASIENAKVLVG